MVLNLLFRSKIGFASMIQGQIRPYTYAKTELAQLGYNHITSLMKPPQKEEEKTVEFENFIGGKCEN